VKCPQNVPDFFINYRKTLEFFLFDNIAGIFSKIFDCLAGSFFFEMIDNCPGFFSSDRV